ncbi:NAD(P)/FAD-dependent oxidoreductase [Labrys sp. KB_33_2]|uniref:NAD(P)/FAD-dependent oxidoreductase n=1 Tax=Labrys sp. KB_33_2 TaxID=3237479 RepID=UPI003F938C06
MGKAAFDFVIIGGGMAGASLAYELAETDRVLLIEREQFCGYHTTGRSAALFSETYGNATIRALTRASRGLYEAPPAGFADLPLLTPRPVLFIARADQVARLAAFTDILAEASGKKPTVLDTAQARAHVPILRTDYVAQALLDGSSRDIDVHALHQGYLRGAKARGAELVTSAELLGLDRQAGHWRIRTSSGSFEAGTVINAAGAWASTVGGLAGASTVVLTPLRRTAMMLDMPRGFDGTAWPMAIDIDEAFYFKPDAGRLLASPADETPSDPCDAQPEELDIAIAIDRIQRAADLPVRTIARRWAGLRTFAADRSPVVGYDPKAEGFFWLAGQGGYGIQTAPALARAAAALVRCRPVEEAVLAEGFDPTAVSPARPGLEAAIVPHEAAEA